MALYTSKMRTTSNSNQEGPKAGGVSDAFVWITNEVQIIQCCVTHMHGEEAL